jgi:quinol monooxygenase YgiN
MRPVSRALLAMAILATTSAESAHQPSTTIYVATYVEAMPNAVGPAAALLEQYREATRAQAGNQRTEVLQEIPRPNRFAILEVWSSDFTLKTHDTAPSTANFREQLTAIQNAPPDERVGRALYLPRGTGESDAAATIHVLTHVDVTPDHREEFMGMAKDMSIETAKEDGNLGYQVLEQRNRLNHFTVMEEWSNRQALEAHAMAAHTRAFRTRLQPLLGALYDERFYKRSRLHPHPPLGKRE